MTAHNIMIKHNGNCRKISAADILFIESNNKKIIIHTVDETIDCYQKMVDITGELGSSFFRCHRCYTVNLESVTGYTSTSIQLKNSKNVPLARRKRAMFVEAYMTYNNSVNSA